MNFFKTLFGNKAENEADKQREDNQKHFDILKYDGVRAVKMGQMAYAIQCFDHALSLQDDLETRDYYAQALVANHQLSEAYDQLQQLSEARPDQAAVWIRMAEVAYMMEQYGEMTNACAKALLLTPDDPLVHLMYGKAYIGQNDPSNALAMLNKAILLKEDFIDARLLRATINLEAGDVNAADEDVADLLTRLNDHEDVLILKARLEKARGNTAQALLYYGKTIDANPFCLVAFDERAQLRRETGDSQGADQDMNTVAELQQQLQTNSDDNGNQGGIEQQVKQAYRNVDAYGVFSN